MKEVGLSAYHFDAQAFLFAAHDMDGGDFAALDTLQYGLARDVERKRLGKFGLTLEPTKTELLPPQHKPAHVQICQQW